MNNSKTVYLVDYENVHEDGLNGAKKLTDNDIVCIFTSQKTATSPITIKSLSLLNHVELHCFIVQQRKQSVDMCISSYLGHLITKYEGDKVNYVIVSLDKDYESVIRFWAKLTSSPVARRGTIA